MLRVSSALGVGQNPGNPNRPRRAFLMCSSTSRNSPLDGLPSRKAAVPGGISPDTSQSKGPKSCTVGLQCLSPQELHGPYRSLPKVLRSEEHTSELQSQF